ncbi:ankyrin [Cyathus striatus]|nr:ankyrin [Cyathus striatus]
MAQPSNDDNDELLLSCRYGDLEDAQNFVKQFGKEALTDIRDQNGNCILHMACGNCHLDLLDYLLPLVPPSLLSTQNNSGSTPLHWAAVNSHLDVVQKLVQFPDGPGIDLIDIKNKAGHSPLAEAEFAGWDEGAKWLVQMMKLDPEEKSGNVDAPEDEDTVPEAAHNIEVEIEDADGQIAKMSISGGGDSKEP